MRKQLLLCLFSFFLCANAFSAPPQKIIFFGDSLTDTGNLYSLDLHFLPKSPPYYSGRFSNGPTWAENVGNALRERYKTEYRVYAWGGATTVGHNPFTQITFPITLSVELNRYLFDTLFRDHSKTLFAIWMGGNDYLFDHNDDIDGLTTRVVDEITRTIDVLTGYHATQFLVMNMPDLARTPKASDKDIDAKRLHDLSIMHNQKLDIAIQKLRQEHPEITIVYIDVGFFFDDLLNNPAKYNEKRHVDIRDTVHSCWMGGYTLKQPHLPAKRAENTPDMTALEEMVATSPDLREAWKIGKLSDEGYSACKDPEHYVFWDTLHPTAVAHQMIAARVLDSLAEAGIS